MLRFKSPTLLVAGGVTSLSLAVAAGVLTTPVATAAALGDVTLYSAPGASTARTGDANFLSTVAVIDDTAWASAGRYSGLGITGLLAADVAGDDSAIQVPLTVGGQAVYVCAVTAGPTGGAHDGKLFVSYMAGSSFGCSNISTGNSKGILRVDNVTGQVDDSWTINALSANGMSGLAFQDDTTLWLGSYGDSIVYRMDLTGSRTSPTLTAIPVGTCGANSPISQMVHLDDTVYVLNSKCSTLVGVNVLTDDTVTLGGPYAFEWVAGLATSSSGDVWFTSHATSSTYVSTLRVFRPSTASQVASATLAGQTYGVAIPNGSSSVYVSAGEASSPANRLYVLDLSFGASTSVTLSDTLPIGGSTVYALVPGPANQGSVIAGSLGQSIVRVGTAVPPAAPTLDSATGTPGGIEIAWTEFSDGGSPITEVVYAINGFTRRSLGTLTSPATITSDSLGNSLVPGTTYTVRIQLRNALGYSSWSNSLTATPTDPTPPPPPVTYPPGPPTDVVAVAGDAGAMVAWSTPADGGSFPISDYEVKASPGGAGCLVKVPATTCAVGDLANGTAYTFEVRALNGAGWGAWSSPSAAVTPVGPKPTPTIVITGSRGSASDVGRVFADGVTTHLTGRQVQARVHLSGQTVYENGSVRTVASNGTFRWQRKTNKTVYVYFRALDQRDVRSNRIVIRPN